jgi:hypothetical protein
VEVETILGLMMRGVCRVIPHTDFDDDKFKYGLSGKWMVDKNEEIFYGRK